MPTIRFDFGTLTLDAELLDTPTAHAITIKPPLSWANLTSASMSNIETVRGAP